MRIFNINSQVTPDIEFIKKYISYGFIFNKILKNMDIFIVNEELMDVINPPLEEPEISCADEMIKSNANKISALRHPMAIAIANVFEDEKDKNMKRDEFTDISEILGKCRKVKYNVSGFYAGYSTIGNIFNSIFKYNSSLDKNMYDLINNNHSSIDTNKIKKAIFICHERIIKSSTDLKVDPNTAFLITLFHELTHAYMDSSKKLDYYNYRNRIIEESLCEAMSYDCFKGTEFDGDVAKFVFESDKPLSYKCGIYISEIAKTIPLISIVNRWKHGNVKEILFYFYEFEKLSDDICKVLKQGPFFNRTNIFYNIANRSDDYASNLLAMIIVEKTFEML
ncbi:hypothetical protein [Picrophilus oshimae]|uniref:Uncharacterized protein n=1 Tax=Picrophilus torridus (strain ATCC 700027 / DSM 9790 / JCM 10055 / NBRC 100828 / KAW 2/3) TaxID=1122961 RepID=A0A8G2FXV6_PICTO|nr:hypothetical protein [Picrophilus oshimae]SMD31428.1 hypothetical protein SAMN02745355_1367 [Picrophilus oshimae DSM 9789]